MDIGLIIILQHIFLPLMLLFRKILQTVVVGFLMMDMVMLHC